MGFGLFIALFRKSMTRDDLFLLSRVTYRILLLFILSTLILGKVFRFSPATFLLILGTGLGVITGILVISVSLGLYLQKSTSSNH